MHRIFVALLVVPLVAGCAGASGSVEQPGDGATTTVAAITPPDLTAAAADLVASVEAVRGSSFTAPPEVQVVAPSDTSPPRDIYEADRAAFESARVRLLYGGEQEAPADWVARYNVATSTVEVSAKVTALTPYVRSEIVRALLLALADDRFGWVAGVTQDEAGRALQALAEGDAEYYTGLWIERTLDVNDQLAVRLEAIDRTGTGTPRAGSTAASFYRDAGSALVEELVSRGGANAVDEAYADPPVTTEQVYHPARYLAGEGAVAVAVPEVEMPPGYRQMSAEEWGELGWRALLAGELGGAEALQASTGWGGDSVELWWNGEDVLMVAIAAGDTDLDTVEFDGAMRRWALERVGAGRTDWKGVAFDGVDAYAFVGRLDAGALLIVASDPGDGRRYRDNFFPTL